MSATALVRWALVEPAWLDGERVVVIWRDADLDDARAANGGLPVYLQSELRELERHDPALSRAAHRISNALDAAIIPRDSALGIRSCSWVAIPAERLLDLDLDLENDSHA